MWRDGSVCAASSCMREFRWIFSTSRSLLFCELFSHSRTFVIVIPYFIWLVIARARCCSTHFYALMEYHLHFNDYLWANKPRTTAPKNYWCIISRELKGIETYVAQICSFTIFFFLLFCSFSRRHIIYVCSLFAFFRLSHPSIHSKFGHTGDLNLKLFIIFTENKLQR